MVTYIIRKLLMLIPMILILTLLVYAGLELMPGDVVSFMVGPEGMAGLDPAQLDAVREAMGLNDPFPVRYLNWLGGVITGDLGYSMTSGVPIASILASRVPATLELSVTALILSTLVGVVLGIISALRRRTAVDDSLTVLGMVGLSIPDFFFALVLIVVFALNLGWLPAGGRLTPGDQSLGSHLSHLVLPASALAIAMTAGVMRYSRSSMLDVANRMFITTARSKGMPEWRVQLLHGFRVALTPVIVLVSFRLPMLIGGSVVIEQIFQWPGVGSAFIAAVRAQDYPLIMMITLLSVGAVLLASLFVDLCTAWVDPRVRLS